MCYAYVPSTLDLYWDFRVEIKHETNVVEGVLGIES